jgi:hypothetical protein
MAQASTVLRWGGRLLVVAGAVNGVAPQGDCGSAFFPHSGALESYDSVMCVAARADQLQTALLLGGLGVVAMIAGQVIGWRGQRGTGGAA